MRFFVKAIASGFAMSLGSAIFKKVSKKIGLDEEKTEKEKDEEEKAHAVEAEGELEELGGDADGKVEDEDKDGVTAASSKAPPDSDQS
jgi:hypothetical protein